MKKYNLELIGGPLDGAKATVELPEELERYKLTTLTLTGGLIYETKLVSGVAHYKSGQAKNEIKDFLQKQ